MSDFEKWWEGQEGVEYPDPYSSYKAAYLAGQSSAEQRIKELEEQYDLVTTELREKIAKLERERNEAENDKLENYRKLAECRKKLEAALKAQAGEHTRRWNIEPDGNDLLVCKGDHDKDEKCEYIRYTPSTPAAERPESALERFNKFGANEEQDALERLRFFCSLAMGSQDWIDVEQFFDAITAERPDHRKVMEMALAAMTDRWASLEKWNEAITALREALKGEV